MRNLIVAVSILFASTAFAAEYSDLYVIPIAGHAHGAHGTEWRSDVVLHNFQLVPITVEMAFIEGTRTSDIGSPFQLFPGETRTITDVLGDHGRDVIGAIVIGGDKPFVVTSRTYNGNTLGQTVRPIAIAGAADAVNEVAVLAGLSRDANQRANVGLVAIASHVPFIAEIELVSAEGAHLGSQLIMLEGEGFAHRQFRVTGGASAVVRVLQGDGIIVPYASVIDNRSGEALFVSTEPAASAGANALLMLDSMVSRSTTE
ncbi:MAG TPA: hypothetical protein VEK79_15285 [Thermoanaerobaculia bacterium]|nr:hypothetical protein [Thermoanaerobaculia bacterium]